MEHTDGKIGNAITDIIFAILLKKNLLLITSLSPFISLFKWIYVIYFFYFFLFRKERTMLANAI